MTNDHAIRPIARAAGVACAILSVVAMAVAPVWAQTPPPAPEEAPAPAPTNEIEQKLEYADLPRFVGKTIRVKTTFKTVRTGTLLKYTEAALTVKLPDREGGMELSMPRDTVREVSSPVRIDEPFFAEPGADGAKKE
jgi:hypothetical protein